MGTHLLDPKEGWAHEAFPRDPPRPDFLGRILDRPSPSSYPDVPKKLGVGKKPLLGKEFSES